MALDHFVSQVHLRTFYAQKLNHRKMYAWRKSNLAHFFSDARDVCRIPEGSTNQFVSEPRAVEEFLRLVEPRYNKACAAAFDQSMVFDDVFALAGFTAFVATCSPTAIRLARSSITALVDTQARLLDEKGMIAPSPDELGRRSLSQLLDDEAISINVDGKFAQSIGIAQILEITNAFADTTWEFVRNPFEDSPFLTSDFPVVIAPIVGDLSLRRFVPFRPDLGAYINPSRAALSNRPLQLNNFRSVARNAKRSEVHRLNRLIVQCAEDMIFSNIKADWIGRLVGRNANLAVVNTSGRLKTDNGYYTFTSQGIRERPA